MNLFKTLQSHPVITGIVSVAAIAVVIAGSALAWGLARKLFTMAHPADHPTFNSITDNPDYGDERGFTTIKDITAGTGNGHNTTPVPVAELPHTGFALNALGITGLGALSYAGYAYVASRRSL